VASSARAKTSFSRKPSYPSGKYRSRNNAWARQFYDIVVDLNFIPLGAITLALSIRFPPPQVADRFSHENAAPTGPTFGFHGLGNIWRYLGDGELVAFVDDLHPYVYETPHYAKRIIECFVHKRDAALIPLYSKVRSRLTWDPNSAYDGIASRS
jgi:hypothetical protein